MNKIDKLVSLVLSELEGGKLITNKKPSEVSYYVDQTLIFEFEEYPYYINEVGRFDIYNTLPAYGIIKNTLNEDEFFTFIKKFIISISPMLSDYLDMNKVTGFEIQDWMRTKTTVFLDGEN
jgi:hypothetical protein